MMSDEIPDDVVEAVQARLGPLYDELLTVMLDVDAGPIFLFSDDRSRVVDVRERVCAVVRAWAEAEPSEVQELVDRLPQVLHLPDVTQTLVEAVGWIDYYDLPNAELGLPTRTDTLYSTKPGLAELLDDDGLLFVEGLEATPHGIFYEDLALHYHQLLRRGFGANVNYDLVGAILGTASRQPAKARLAIDGRRLRYRSEYQKIEERDAWYGPPLTNEALDDPHLVGETVHGDPELGKSILNPYVATSFRWTKDGQQKTVEIEELIPISEGSTGPVLVRYLHAIRDTNAHHFIHCDGAVKAYDRSSYPRSIDAFAARGKGLHYRKVFRLDGEIDTEAWSWVTSLWFRGNQLVLEYLAGLGPREGGQSA